MIDLDNSGSDSDPSVRAETSEMLEQGREIIDRNRMLIIDRLSLAKNMPETPVGVHRMNYNDGDPLGWAVEAAAEQAYESLRIKDAMAASSVQITDIHVQEKFRPFYAIARDTLKVARKSVVVETEADGTIHTLIEDRYTLVDPQTGKKQKFIALIAEESEQ